MKNPLPLLLFDGLCHLCSGSVQWVLKHDHAGRIHFVSIQSDLGQRLYKDHGFDPDQPHSMMLITDHGVFTKSEAVIELAGIIGGWYRLLKIGRLLPQTLRDMLYDMVAQNRYRWFGKHESCWLPKPEWKSRFLI